MKLLKYICVLVILVSCSNDDERQIDNNLSAYILNRTIEIGAVIACAASDKVTNEVLVFYYPESGASNIKLFETDALAEKNEFLNYTEIETEPVPFFNG
jgi:hypothetical protein